jgi:hypothetical protein
MSKFKVGDRVVDVSDGRKDRGVVHAVSGNRIQVDWGDHENPQDNGIPCDEDDFVLESEYDALKEEKSSRIKRKEVFEFFGHHYVYSLGEDGHVIDSNGNDVLTKDEIEEFIEFLKLGLK